MVSEGTEKRVVLRYWISPSTGYWAVAGAWMGKFSRLEICTASCSRPSDPYLTLNQITKINNNSLWETHLKERIRLGGNPADATAVTEYLTAVSTHKELMARYWPATDLSPDEKLMRTANRVGLNLPKMFSEENDIPTTTSTK